ncbi:MAG: chorismate mutase [Actinomycetaceae bacterium]|nr:chorismate mutase [Actinomycetaceae bacterium]
MGAEHFLEEPTDIPAELAEARKTIDNIDAALVHMLAERFRCTEKVGVIKAKYDLPPADLDREKRQVARLQQFAADSGLDPEFEKKFLRFIVDEVLHHHERIREEMENNPSAMS